MKRIYTLKKSAENSTAFCSIILINKQEAAQNIISFILLILSILLFFLNKERMKEYSATGFFPINYQQYHFMTCIIEPILYIISAISLIVITIDSLFPTIITYNDIKVNGSVKYNKNDVVFKLEQDKIIILDCQTKDTIVCIENQRKEKEQILEILKLYYTEEINELERV